MAKTQKEKVYDIEYEWTESGTGIARISATSKTLAREKFEGSDYNKETDVVNEEMEDSNQTITSVKLFTPVKVRRK